MPDSQSIKERIIVLNPTQIAVGYQQVHEKTKKLKKKSNAELEEYLIYHQVPVIKGPHDALFLIDHHHLCCAAHDIGIKKVYIKVVNDWSDLPNHEFWSRMQEHNYIWLYDDNGKALDIETFLHLLPKTIKDLKNDPYRSMAGVIRKLEVYKKDWTPFSEFKWANFLRDHMELDHSKSITKFPTHQVDKAVELATSHASYGLPGR